MRRKFTLLELLIVIAVIMMLVALLLPALSSARKRALVASCLGNMRQLGQVMLNYAGDHQDYLPLMAHPTQLWYAKGMKGFLTDPDGKWIDTYVRKGDKNFLYCPSLRSVGLEKSDFIGYNIIGFSCSPQPGSDAAGHYAGWLTNRAYYTLSRLSANSMPMKTGGPAKNFSERILAADLMYAPQAVSSVTCAPNWGSMKKLGGAHDWEGMNGVFADGHAIYRQNVLKRFPSTEAEAVYMWTSSKFYTTHWSQSFYMPLAR